MRLPLLLSVLGLLTSCSSTRMASRTANPEADAQFERLKSLEGEWVVTGEGAAQPEGQTVSYRITGQGSALVETLFAGTPGEMVTVYHRDGDALVLTHYCSLGNQPRMVAVPTGDPDAIRFRFDGGTNVDPRRGSHMHAVEHVLADDAHLRSTWTLYTDGEPSEHAEFQLVRSWR